MPNQIPRTINLLESNTAPKNTWDKIYDWVFSAGRYIIILVELVVILAFASRFYFDRINNDLKEKINVDVQMLQGQADFERQVRSVQSVLSAISDRSEKQFKMSSTLIDVLSEIPANIQMNSFSLNEQDLTLSCQAPSYEVIEQMEGNFNTNSKYKNVMVALSKAGKDNTLISFTISMSLVKQ